MTDRNNKYFKLNYTTLIKSKENIILNDGSSVSYELTQRNSNSKEYIVWLNRIIDMSEFDLEPIEEQIKTVIFSETEHGALNQAFKKYYKGHWQGFRFRKDFKIDFHCDNNKK